MMKINQIVPTYGENNEVLSVKVWFTGSIGDINLNGPITFSGADAKYFLDTAKAETAVRNKLVETIINDGQEEGAE